ncbi:hypothetical protein N7466_005047 [Penicillium verhagenii]|uniref:uncharacterized protein n=1 Tax=Penicillium verhagenii TaxID=1562060 RepID=UPI00254590DF|nr:uncharacterized protein N7466_005047 [Penicillium verhagenii]KAJ5935500.1 hypothetical protein N7466_005047 [Penicillium verhagenii]
MVVFVDLDSDAFTEHPGSIPGIPFPYPSKLTGASVATAATATAELSSSPTFLNEDQDHDRHRECDRDRDRHTNIQTSSSTSDIPAEEPVNLNRSAFSAALSCYPIVKEIARAIDLNTLYDLSRTCRQFHANLAPFRHQLVRETLRCENQYIETVSEMLDAGTAIPSSVKSVLQLLSNGNSEPGRMTRGKVGRCARDMVGECQRCSKVVCRNCTIKPPSQSTMKGRIRRLCRTCNTAPLSQHLSGMGWTDGSYDALDTDRKAVVLSQNICRCTDTVWLCVQCGQNLRSSDTTYRRVWAWRTRYSTYLGGGLGTGIGEGCQGVKCGRGEFCLAGQEIELEVDCEADEGSSDTSSTGYHSPVSHTPATAPASSLYQQELASSDSHDDEEPGYFRQEVIGLGGVVKHKSKKRVMVGACVVEYEDEREKGSYLEREESGLYRAWCGWCSKVIPA